MGSCDSIMGCIYSCNKYMVLVYAEFPSLLPPSMSDEEIEQLKKQYRENHRSKRESKPEVERIDTEDIIEQI